MDSLMQHLLLCWVEPLAAAEVSLLCRVCSFIVVIGLSLNFCFAFSELLVCFRNVNSVLQALNLGCCSSA